jgi:cytidylate kinase
VRAVRRYKELVEKGETPDINAIAKDIAERDYRDMHREIAPLRQAEDAVLVDTSDMGIDEVAERILEIVREKTA